jgi:PAS domain S-box-containing protein
MDDHPMEPHPFVRQLETVHQRAAALLERAQEVAPHSLRDWTVAEPTQAQVLRQTWDELTHTMAELLTVHDAFQAQHPRYQDLLEFAPDGYVITDTHGLILEADEAATELFATPPAGLAGQRLTVFVAPDAVLAFEQSLSQLAVTISSKHGETRLLSRQGMPFEGAYVVVPARDAAGRVVGLRWLVWDISERKRQDQALLAARQVAEQAAERTARLQAVIAGLAEARTADHIIAAVVQHGASALGAASGALNMLSPDGTRLTLVGAGYSEQLMARFREFSVSATMPGADVLRSGEQLWLGSAQEFSTRYPHLAEAAGRAGVLAVAVFPLWGDERPLGALLLSFTQKREFAPEDQAFLLALARLSAQALARIRALQSENEALRQDVAARARVQVESDRDLEQLHTYNADLALVREEERRRLALELHDQLGGALTALKMDVFLLRRALGGREQAVSVRLGTLSDSITDTITLVRSLASELRPAMLDDLGLPAALEWAAGEFEARFGIACRWVSNTDQVALDSPRATAIFRVVQECLTNIVRHAQATRVTITLQASASELMVAVSDDGQGFAYSEAVYQRSVGLAGIHERVRGIGGELEIETAPGQGTVVRVRVALFPAPPDPPGQRTTSETGQEQAALRGAGRAKLPHLADGHTPPRVDVSGAAGA